MPICYTCGDPLDRRDRCINLDCEEYSQPPCEHPQGRWLECMVLDCPDRYRDRCGPEPQTFCEYCEYFAEPDGTCCDDECPSQDPEFMALIEAHWAVRDGLVRPEGGLTEMGERHKGWLKGRVPAYMTKEVETKA